MQSYIDRARKYLPAAGDLWEPKLHNIERWWSAGSLAALKSLRQALDEYSLPSEASDLFSIAFCRTAIAASNAAFNHQSMSFKSPNSLTSALFDPDDAEITLESFAKEARLILDSASIPLPVLHLLFLAV
jgi:hypothetical protein